VIPVIWVPGASLPFHRFDIACEPSRDMRIYKPAPHDDENDNDDDDDEDDVSTHDRDNSCHVTFLT
jgi:hypothetical protein